MISIPAITGTQMAEIDTLMMEHIGVTTLQLMELAGYGVADAARRRIDMQVPRNVVALAGTGGNGGDAMVAARLLAGWGHQCTVLLSHPRPAHTGITAHQLASLNALGIPVVEAADITSLPNTDLILDGLVGFSLRGHPRGEIARLIHLANAHPAPILAIDLPSGLNADTGEAGEPCIIADETVTLALPKTGLMAAHGSITGSIVVADIGVPPQVYASIGIEVEPRIFASGNVQPVR